MKAIIYDVEAIRALRPFDVALYLRAKGWIQQDTNLEKASLWYQIQDADRFEVLLPMDLELQDYALRMGDVLTVLATFEKRSQLQVYSDMLTVASDIVRIRIADPELADGALPIEENASIAQKVRDLILAAACAATEHRSVWHKRKPAQVMNYMRRVRVGQSERGSYVMTIISRVPPLLKVPDEQMFAAETPFERRVTQTLAQALRALDHAAANAAVTQNMEAFDRAVQQGVNANLCDAVVGLWGDNEAQRRLEFLFSWSPVLKIPKNSASRIVFSPDRVPVIREAARQMREREPLPDVELSGPVIKLERSDGATTGRVTVMGLVDERQVRVLLELAEKPYHLALQAHDSGRTIRTSGTLIREGRGFVMKNFSDPVIEEIEPVSLFEDFE